MPTLATGAGLGKWPPDRLAPDSQIAESKRPDPPLSTTGRDLPHAPIPANGLEIPPKLLAFADEAIE
jgi:hypothetical protein